MSKIKKEKKQSKLTGYILGVIITIFGVVSFIQPEFFVIFLMLFFGVSMIISGISQIASPLKGVVKIMGIISLVIGIIAVSTPLIFGEKLWSVLLLVFGIERLLHAAITIWMGWKVRFKMPKGRFFMDVALSILVGLLLITSPQILGTTFIRVIAVIITIVGVTTLLGNHRSGKESKVISSNM